MTGPDVNRRRYGGNAIGAFQIGASPIGNVAQFDYWETILSQYANSPLLIGMIDVFWRYVDQTQNLDNFFDLIRNVDTAQGYGLDVWGRIVAVNRVLRLGVGPRYFGFDEGLPDYDPFNTSPFYSGQTLTQNYALTDDGFRVLILAKAFSNICDGSIRSINALMRMLFGGGGTCFVRDDGNMQFTYVFQFVPTLLQTVIITQSGVMPKPAGVDYAIEHP